MKEIDKIKELENDINLWAKLEGVNSIEHKKRKELSEAIEELNRKVDWIGEVGSFDNFLDNILQRQNNFADKLDYLNMIEFFKSELRRLLENSSQWNNRKDSWAYCSDKNLKIVLDCQNQKLSYIKNCLLENGIDTHGPVSMKDSKYGDFNFYNVRGENNDSISLTEKEKSTAKIRLTLLYKLGIIEHLRKFESLKNNDRALSRLLSKLFEITKPETFQTYISAHRSGDASSAPQNNPLSRKLIEKAEDILSKTDLTNSEIQKYHPLK